MEADGAHATVIFKTLYTALKNALNTYPVHENFGIVWLDQGYNALNILHFCLRNGSEEVLACADAGRLM